MAILQSVALPAGLGALAVLLVPLISVLAICLYRLYFHPLARYPGPLLARLSSFYSAYHAWKGDIHIDMRRCHEKYGRVVRYAPDRVLFDSVQAVKDIYGYNSNVVKSTSYNALLHRAPNILTARDKKVHGKIRRIISQGFSDANLRALEEPVIAQILNFCNVLGSSSAFKEESSLGPVKQGWGPARDMSKLCDYLAIDIMSSVIFSSKRDALTDSKYRWVPDAISESNVRVSVLFQIPEWKGFLKLDKYLFPEAIAARNRFVGFIQTVLGDRLALAKQTNCRDIFAAIANAKDENGQGFGMHQLGAEAATLIVAGSDTTSTALAALFFYLSRHPQAYNRVVTEVRSAFSSIDEIRMGTTLNGCVYLRACIDEALRLCPPAGSALWRQVLKGGIQVDGEFIPEGYDVGTGLFAVHHNPAHFPESSNFVPERFTDPDISNPAFAPFSTGPRSCIGKSLALTELLLTMAHVLYMFDFEKADATDVADFFVTRDHITAIKDGPLLRFRPSNA